VLLSGEDLVRSSARAMRRVRGARIAMVFQDSMTSLNPSLTIGRQISESIELHLRTTHREAITRAVALLEEVGINEPERRLRQYPHQLSGGLRQRVAVAVALAANPEVLIADEPTTALDVTIQAQLLELLRREQRERGMALLLITHDLGVVAGTCDRVAVMYTGRIVEEAAVDDAFARPLHPYTRALLRSVPRIDDEGSGPLPTIPGSPPPLWAIPPGCPYGPRCAHVHEPCLLEAPHLRSRERGHEVACYAELAP
jgi:oligopeptide transport system ATP-binding protein